MKVNVTREMVGYALQQSNSNCAIALALKDADPDITYPRVTQTTISYTDKRTGQRYTFKTPEKMAKWIDDFDHGKAPRPFTFEVNPEEADRVKPIRRGQPSVLARAAQKRNERKVTQTQPIPRSERPLREA